MKHFSLLALCAVVFSMLGVSASAAPHIVFPYEEEARTKGVQSMPSQAVAVPVLPATVPAPPPAAQKPPVAASLPAPQNSAALGADVERAPGAVADDRFASHCVATPPVARISYPGKEAIPTSNMLARPEGKSIFAEGVRLYLTGRVFDAACVPLREARVEIWQADDKGNYRYAGPWTLSNPYQTFAGAGQVETDNRGEYLFETVIPGPLPHQAPFINIRITHPALRSPLVTSLYFAGQSGNEEDPVYRRMPESVKELITRELQPFKLPDGSQGMRVHHDITVRARDGFRGF